ncbi:MAG: methylated-DNA--[protein]-cysteine S-methyltransferase [Chlamydiota bacterium]
MLSTKKQNLLYEAIFPTDPDCDTQVQEELLLKVDWIDTPLGLMLTIADEKALYLLEFMNRQRVAKGIKSIRSEMKFAVTPGTTPPIESIKYELYQYFTGTLKRFETPIKMIGTPFQKNVWGALREIPIGETCSYSHIAKKLNNSGAIRAVGTANGANKLAIVIPCHRVINANGQMGGYAGGLDKKKWLLQHEANL